MYHQYPSIIIFKDGQLFDKKLFGVHLSNETAKLDILDKIYVGRYPETGEVLTSLPGDIAGIVNFIFHMQHF